LGPGFFEKENTRPRPYVMASSIKSLRLQVCVFMDPKVTRTIPDVKRYVRIYISRPDSHNYYWRCPMHTLENMEEDRFQGNHEQAPEGLSL
jgi:hypothetical protein